MTHSYVSYDTYTHIWSIQHNCDMCDMTHSYVWHDSFKSATWLIRRSYVSYHTYERDMICIRMMRHTLLMRHVTHVNESCHTYEWVMSHLWISHITHINESCHTYKWCMSLISRVSCHLFFLDGRQPLVRRTTFVSVMAISSSFCVLQCVAVCCSVLQCDSRF